MGGDARWDGFSRYGSGRDRPAEATLGVFIGPSCNERCPWEKGWMAEASSSGMRVWRSFGAGRTVAYENDVRVVLVRRK